MSAQLRPPASAAAASRTPARNARRRRPPASRASRSTASTRGRRTRHARRSDRRAATGSSRAATAQRRGNRAHELRRRHRLAHRRRNRSRRVRGAGAAAASSSASIACARLPSAEQAAPIVDAAERQRHAARDRARQARESCLARPGRTRSGSRSTVTAHAGVARDVGERALGLPLARGVVVARVGRVALAKRPSGQRRFAVHLDRAREHEVRDARARRGARQALGRDDVGGAVSAAADPPRVSRITCARPARCTTARAPAARSTSAPSAIVRRDRRRQHVRRAPRSPATARAPGRGRRRRARASARTARAPTKPSAPVTTTSPASPRRARAQNHFQPCLR